MAPTARSILHVDLDAFFASVEELLDPSIVGLPIVVGGDADKRGVVSSASYAARAYGVHSAMPMAQALRLCPQAVVRHGHHGKYSEYSRRVMDMLAQYTPVWEQISIDEAFLDVTGCDRLFGHAEQIARRIQHSVLEELGLPCSIGVASNRLVAKIASALAKPKGLLIVPAGHEAAFLAPLPIERLWGVGKVTAQRVRACGVETIGDLAGLPLAEMRALFGSMAESMHERALGIDDSPVGAHTPRQSISHERTFPRDVASIEVLKHSLLELSDAVAARLRRHPACARTVVLKLRYPSFETITRQLTLDRPTDLAEVIYAQGLALLRREWKRGMKVRLIGLGVHGLVHGQQLGLFEERQQRLGRLSRAVDGIRNKYGDDAIRRASLLKPDK